MNSVLPNNTGLAVNGVIYKYSISKDPNTESKVSVQNENALGTGYIFRETDDWSYKPGSTINKSVPINNIPLEYWGTGSIVVDGDGDISNSKVTYTYKIDQCANPQLNPICDGYIDPLLNVSADNVEYYDATKDSAVQNATEEADVEYIDEEEKELDDEEIEEIKKRLERALSASANALALANKVSQDAIISSMNISTNINSYYNKTIQGGVYNDTNRLVDREIPDNNQGLLNGLAQQLLHQKMIDMQYQ